MTEPAKTFTQAPIGDLSTFSETPFDHGGSSYQVFRKGSGPAVLVITEMPGISPMVLGFADRVVALGCTAVLPDLFGTAGRDPLAGNKVVGQLRSFGTVLGTCIRRDFTALAAGKSSPVVDWLRALAHHEHAECGGPGVGVVGMCFTGGFALAMAVDDVVLAPVLSQPSLPFPISKKHKASIDTSPADIDIVAGRCANDGLKVIGLRFDGDPYVPKERFRYLEQKLGSGFVAVELAQSDGNPSGPLPHRHSVLTGDLIDEPGERTRDALDQVLNLLETKLLPGASGT
ncbi:MAG TPA: dienelactone hydrolase family protein [Ilumatobacter sp.]|nr:dienelactone hydrolase family protein [Ilumatobacter sp.]